MECAEAGDYIFSLRRWPLEADAAITGTVPKGKAIKASHARIKIQDHDQSIPLPSGAKEVSFKLKLRQGQCTLQTWFMDKQSEQSRGAYYVYVRRL